MADDVMPTLEQQTALAREAKERMIGRARSWLEDSKVKVVLKSYEPERTEQKQAS